jgi:hypothetical protein
LRISVTILRIPALFTHGFAGALLLDRCFNAQDVVDWSRLGTIAMAEPAKAQPAAGACVWPGPADLRDPIASKKITFNWLKTEATPIEKGPPPPIGTFLMVLALMIAAPMALVWALSVYLDWRSAILIGVVFTVILTILIYLYMGLAPNRLSRAKPKLAPDHRANAALHAWKLDRTKTSFWQRVAASGNGHAFEIECAELMAGLLQTRDVWLTRQTDDYGVDIVACKDGKKYVAQCKLARKGPPSINVIRELAGSTCYFGATEGWLFSMQRVQETRTQASEFARVCKLQFWDLEAILFLAHQLATKPDPKAKH